MGHVVQIDAAHGQHPQVFDHRYLADLRHRVAEIAVFERDEGVEAARAVLQLPQPAQMVDAVCQPLDVAVEDRRIGRDAEPVGRFVHFEPFVRRSLVGADAAADLLVENLRAAARNGLQSGLFEPPQALLDRESRLADHVRQLDRRESLDCRFGQYRLDAADHVDIVFQSVVGVYAAHDMDLGDAFALPAAGDLLDLLHRVVPRFGASGRTAVGAETAVEDAAVRRLDVEIAVEVDLVAAHAPLALRRQLAQQPQGGFAPEPCGFGVADTRSAAYFGGYVVDLLHLIWGLSGRGRRR